tara:strand:- start:559 stop:1722 length:1164 start_codon:yes stop_codon:yes gene_type:complete
MKTKSITLGIDATRNKSGGAINYLQGILNNIDPQKLGFKSIHLWSNESILKKLPNYPWLHKHSHKLLQKNIFYQLLWQYIILKKEFKYFKCDIILNTDAGTISNVKPAITMSRDMLSYEKGELGRFGFSIQTLRLLALRFVQNNSLKKSNGVIFLTKYASKIIQKSSGKIKSYKLIPHGISDELHNIKLKKNWPIKKGLIKILYISNYDLYKHQWHVVEAISQLRKSNKLNYELHLVGGGEGKPQRKLQRSINKFDPKKEFTFLHPFASKKEIKAWLENSDIFVFASSCENMPNTLMEGMAAGLPIACSYRGPMIEVLKDGGLYFNPEESSSIEYAISQLINDEELRNRCKKRAKDISSFYSWVKCSKQTLEFIQETFLNYKKIRIK